MTDRQDMLSFVVLLEKQFNGKIIHNSGEKYSIDSQQCKAHIPNRHHTVTVHKYNVSILLSRYLVVIRNNNNCMNERPHVDKNKKISLLYNV